MIAFAFPIESHLRRLSRCEGVALGPLDGELVGLLRIPGDYENLSFVRHVGQDCRDDSSSACVCFPASNFSS